MTAVQPTIISQDEYSKLAVVGKDDKFTIRLDDGFENESHQIRIYEKEQALALAAALLAWADA